MNKWQTDGKEMPARWAGRAPDSKGNMQTSIHPKKQFKGSIKKEEIE